MHQTCRNGALRPGRLDRFGEPSQPIAADEEDVSHSAVGQLRANPGPELRPLGRLDPDPQDMFDPFNIDAYGDVGGFVADMAAVADFDHESLKVDHQVEPLQRALLPGHHLIEDLVGDLFRSIPD